MVFTIEGFTLVLSGIVAGWIARSIFTPSMNLWTTERETEVYKKGLAFEMVEVEEN